MSSILLNLDSSNISVNDSTGDFTVKFPAPITIKEPHEIALIKANLWYSYYNISSAKGNNTFRYFNGLIFRPLIIIPDGQYTLTQLNDFLHNVMFDNGDFTLNANNQEIYDILIEPNFSTIRTKITLTNGYQLDLSTSDLNLLLGCDKVIIVISGDCPFVANLNDSINSLLIHCDIVSGNGSYANSNKSDILYSFVPNSAPGTNIEVESKNLIFLPLNINNNQISEIRIYIRDNLNRPIDFNGEPVTYLLELRKQQNSIMNKLLDVLNLIVEKFNFLK